MTLNEKYYAINTAINNYLSSKNITARVYKYGVDSALLKTNSQNATQIRYPYFQSSIDNKKQQFATTRSGGILTNFDYQLNYFTGPHDEFQNDAALFWPFEVVANALGDVDLLLLSSIANIKHVSGPYTFEYKSGQALPAAAMIYNMQAVCSYAATLPPATIATDTSKALILEEV